MYDGDTNTVSPYDDAENVNGGKNIYHIAYGKPEDGKAKPVSLGEGDDAEPVVIDPEGVKEIEKKVTKKLEEKSGAPKVEEEKENKSDGTFDAKRDETRETYMHAIPMNIKKEHEIVKVGVTGKAIQDEIDEAKKPKVDAKDTKNEDTANEAANSIEEEKSTPKKTIMPDEIDDATKMAPKPKQDPPKVELPPQEGAFAQAHKKHNQNRRSADTFDGDDSTVDMYDSRHNDGS